METLTDKVKSIFESTWTGDEIEISEIVKMIEDKEDIDTISDYILERINEIEVIYYQSAMELLSEEDDSLKTSLSIADDIGYQPKDLNSELLATLLKRNLCEEELSDILDGLTELLD